MAQQNKPIVDDFEPDSDEFYDYESARKAGAKPDASGHWPSEFKKPGHPQEFVGGYSTITGKPNPNQIQETDPNKLRELGWNQNPADKFEVDDDFQPDELEQSTIKRETLPEADTWSKGFIRSLTSGEALDAGLKGAKGFLKGATLDIPSTIYNSAKQAVTHPIDTLLSSMGPLGDIISGRDSMAPIREASAKAGSEPEEFGRMMGQQTGQPLTTYGLAKGVPPAIRGMGHATELTGNVMRRHTPITGMPGGFLAGRNLRTLERMTGKGIENLGQKMKSVGNTSPTQSSLEMPLQEGDVISQPKTYKVIRDESTKSSRVKPRVKPNGDGTFTNLDTGEVLDSKGQSIIEIDGKPLTKDSPFFIRNQR